MLTWHEPNPEAERHVLGERVRPQPKRTPLSVLVRERLIVLEMRQSDFCRAYQFDQGLLSKIQSGQVERVNLETALKLARGLGVSRRDVLVKAGRADLLDLLEGSERAEVEMRAGNRGGSGDGSEIEHRVDRAALNRRLK